MDNQPDENCNLLFHHPRNSFSARKPSTEFMRRFSVSLEEDIKETGMHLRNLRIKTPEGDKFGRGSSFISLPKRGHVSTEYFGVCFYVWYFSMNTPKARLRRRTFHEPNLIRNNANLNYLDRLN